MYISKLPIPERSGDWHDAPLKWAVHGPDAELQKFSSKRNARLYMSIRKQADSFSQACKLYVAA